MPTASTSKAAKVAPKGKAKSSSRLAEKAVASRGNSTLEGLERALDVLDEFTRPGASSLGVTEIARDLELPKAVVHRILATFASRDFLEVNKATRKYSLGSSWLVMGSTYSQRLDVRTLAADTLRHLSDTTQETSTLSIRHGNYRVYLDQETPRRDVIMSVQVGGRYPLHAGGTGKALLAFLPEETQRAYLETVPLEALTPLTKVSRGELEEEFAIIRARGYASSFGERQEGAGSVAAPLLDFESRPLAVISLCGPVERVRPRMGDLAGALLDQTRALSAKLGHRA